MTLCLVFSPVMDVLPVFTEQVCSYNLATIQAARGTQHTATPLWSRQTGRGEMHQTKIMAKSARKQEISNMHQAAGKAARRCV